MSQQPINLQQISDQVDNSNKTFPPGEHPVEVCLEKIHHFCNSNPVQSSNSSHLAEKCSNLITNLRQAVVLHGIPEEPPTKPYKDEELNIYNDFSDEKDFGDRISEFTSPESRDSARATTNVTPSLRAKVWKMLILGPFIFQKYVNGVEQMNDKQQSTLDSSSPLNFKNYTNAKQYIELVRKGPSKRYNLVRDDSFRTFRTKDEDNYFWSVVPEQSIVRVCNAFDLMYSESTKFEYCQGMNVYAGVFLYVMPELDAFNVFSAFCTQYIPMYWKSNHIGVEAGCALMDKIIAIIDPQIHEHLAKCNPPLRSILYSFHSIKTMCASTPPLVEVVKLWDFILAMGPYVSILCVIAQVLAMRDRILRSGYPKDILDYRKWPRLRSRFIIAIAMAILPMLSNDIRKDLLLHSCNNHVVENLTKRSNYKDHDNDKDKFERLEKLEKLEREAVLPRTTQGYSTLPHNFNPGHIPSNISTSSSSFVNPQSTSSLAPNLQFQPSYTSAQSNSHSSPSPNSSASSNTSNSSQNAANYQNTRIKKYIRKSNTMDIKQQLN